MGRPKKQREFTKQDNAFWFRVQSFLEIAEKDWDWLLTKLEEKGQGVTQTSYTNWMNGYRQPQIETVVVITNILRERQVNVFSPKQLITDGFEINPDGVLCKHNIKEIAEKYRLEASRFYGIYDIPKNSVSRIFRGENCRHDTIVKFFNCFKKEKIDVQNLAELIYFPSFGETPFAYLQLRNKLKLLETKDSIL
jgi:hypothetical protein